MWYYIYNISHVYLFLDSLFWIIDLFLYLQNLFLKQKLLLPRLYGMSEYLSGGVNQALPSFLCIFKSISVTSGSSFSHIQVRSLPIFSKSPLEIFIGISRNVYVVVSSSLHLGLKAVQTLPAASAGHWSFRVLGDDGLYTEPPGASQGEKCTAGSGVHLPETPDPVCLPFPPSPVFVSGF